MEFHYPNFQNDMWRIMGAVFYDDTDHFRVGDEKRFDPKKLKRFYAKRVLRCVRQHKQPFA
ncbi:Mug protein [Actinobacillus equuli]|nr:Mug protein [Actinobacillus equuli]